MINKIAKITLYVNDQEEAKKFWVEQLGFVCHEQQMGPHMKWVEVSTPSDATTSFVLYNKQMMEQQKLGANVGHPSIILSTVNIESSYREMKEKGIEVSEIMNMPYGRMFSFKDQDGNDYLLREDK